MLTETDIALQQQPSPPVPANEDLGRTILVDLAELDRHCLKLRLLRKTRAGHRFQLRRSVAEGDSR